MMFLWKITMKLQECAGILTYPNSTYTVILKMGNNFSNPSTPAKVNMNRLIFNTKVDLEFQTSKQELPCTNLQVMIVMTEDCEGERGRKVREEKIIGIATLKLGFPLPAQLKDMKIYKIDKSFDSKATIKAEISLSKHQHADKKKAVVRKPSLDLKPKSLRQHVQRSTDNQYFRELYLLEKQQNEEYRQYVNFMQKQLQEAGEKEEAVVNEYSVKDKNQSYDQIETQKNQLYKMSEDLYEELKQCLKEKEALAKQLNLKTLSEEEMREEICFLKLKLEECQSLQSITDKDKHNHTIDEQLQQLKSESYFMRLQIEQKDKNIKQLERKVKECLVAIDQFKNEALSARTELFHKQSQISFNCKQNSKIQMDFQECIQQLTKELALRRSNSTSVSFSRSSQLDGHIKIVELIENIRKDVTQLFIRLLGRLKVQKQKQWLIRQKVEFQKNLEQKLVPIVCSCK